MRKRNTENPKMVQSVKTLYEELCGEDEEENVQKEEKEVQGEV